MKDTLSFLVQSLLQKNKITIDAEELDFQIQSHPSYPSLHAITGVLNHFNIENAAIQVPVNEKTLAQLPNSFIAQIKIENTSFFALVIKKGFQYKVITNNKKSKIISIQTFLDQFTGILVGIEKDDKKNINQLTTVNYQKPLFVIALFIFCVMLYKYNTSIYARIYFGLSLIGVAISYLIVQHDLGLSSKIVDSICSQESKTTNCNAVLNSKGATLYKNIKLSDVSFIYFVAITVSVLLLSLANTSLNTMYLLSLAGIPIVIYSIYYQIKISKNWCVLCLSIASILVLQASFFFFTSSNILTINILSVLVTGFSFSVVASIWLFINSKLKQEQGFKKLKIESKKFKMNFELFNTLLQKSETLNTTLVNTSEIVLGNKNAPLNITAITNPFCGHCKSVHNLIETLLKKHHNNINVTIRFNINTSNLGSNGVLVSSRLLELFHTEGELKCLEAMHDIYNNADATNWLTKWEEATNPATYINTLETEYNWRLNNDINFTPAILINGKIYPKEYNREDLLFFIEDLNEACFADTATVQLPETT